MKSFELQNASRSARSAKVLNEAISRLVLQGKAVTIASPCTPPRKMNYPGIEKRIVEFYSISDGVPYIGTVVALLSF